jgi:hypothetical protein
MSDGKIVTSTVPCSLSEELLVKWFVGGDTADSLDQWIFWNNSPSRHVPLTTLAQFFPEKFHHILADDARFRAQVDVVLRSKLSWSDPVHWMPQDLLWEISLAAPERFQRLAFLAAALSMKELLAKIIDGALVRKLRQEIGADIIEFTLLSGSLAKYAFAALPSDLTLVEDPVLALRQRALLFVNHAFSTKERGVQQRIATKMPGCFSTGWESQPSPLALKTEELLSQLWKETCSWI